MYSVTLEDIYSPLFHDLRTAIKSSRLTRTWMALM